MHSNLGNTRFYDFRIHLDAHANPKRTCKEKRRVAYIPLWAE